MKDGFNLGPCDVRADVTDASGVVLDLGVVESCAFFPDVDTGDLVAMCSVPIAFLRPLVGDTIPSFIKSGTASQLIWRPLKPAWPLLTLTVESMATSTTGEPEKHRSQLIRAWVERVTHDAGNPLIEVRFRSGSLPVS